MRTQIVAAGFNLRLPGVKNHPPWNGGRQRDGAVMEKNLGRIHGLGCLCGMKTPG